MVNDVLISTDYIRGTMAATTPAGAVAVITGAVVLLGSGAVIAVGDRPPWLAYLTVTVLLIAQFVVLASVLDPSRMPAVWWAWQLMVPAFVLVVGVLPTARAVVVVVAAVAGYVFIRVLPASGAAAGWLTAASEVTLALVFVAVGVVFVPAWRQTAVIADGSARAREAEFARTEAARAVDRQDRAASRLLHDEVIHALRAVALPAGAIEASRVRAMAAEASDLLSSTVAGPPAPRDLRQELRDLTVGHLAPRQIQVFELLAQGVGRGDIGRLMDPPAATSTVDTYLKRAARTYRTLGRETFNAYETLQHVIRDGHVDPPGRPPAGPL